MDPERARALLAAERERIERALGRLVHQDTGEPADEEDPSNLATDLYQDELDEGLADDLREELAGIERAEARLAAGTYGLSIESGQPIPDERLEAIPTAERTTEEEARRERTRASLRTIVRLRHGPRLAQGGLSIPEPSEEVSNASQCSSCRNRIRHRP